MVYKYSPVGVCARGMEVELDEDGKIIDVRIIGGCQGNTRGIMSLVKGRNAEEVIELLDGIQCGDKGTSCPDQLAQCLREALELI